MWGENIVVLIKCWLISLTLMLVNINKMCVYFRVFMQTQKNECLFPLKLNGILSCG